MTSPHPRSLTRLVGANLAAQSAEQLSLAAVPIVAVLALGAGPGEIGLLATAQTLPFLLLSIPLGLLADRTSRRTLMVVSELVRAGVRWAAGGCAVRAAVAGAAGRAGVHRGHRHGWLQRGGTRHLAGVGAA